MVKVFEMTKIRGKKIASIEGLEIYVSHRKPKRRGMERLWVSVRQNGAKKWRVGSTLSYSKAVDVRFEK